MWPVYICHLYLFLCLNSIYDFAHFDEADISSSTEIPCTKLKQAACGLPGILISPLNKWLTCKKMVTPERKEFVCCRWNDLIINAGRDFWMQHRLLWTKSNLWVWSPHFDSMFELQCPFYILLIYLNISHTWFLKYLALSCAENGHKLILWHPHGIFYLLFVWHGQGIGEPKMCGGRWMLSCLQN